MKKKNYYQNVNPLSNMAVAQNYIAGEMCDCDRPPYWPGLS